MVKHRDDALRSRWISSLHVADENVNQIFPVWRLKAMFA